MFWGLVLEPSKKYTQKVDQTFHISQAALDLKSCDFEPIQLVVEYENSNFVLATLSKKANIFQVPLDLIFKTGDEISFRTIGNGKVHLSGYHVLEDIDSMLMNGEEESDTDEGEEIIRPKGKRKKPTSTLKGGKKARLDEDESNDEDFDQKDDDSDEEGDDSDEEDMQTAKVGKQVNKKLKSDSLLLSMDDDDDGDDYDDDDDDEDEDEDEDEEEEEENDMDEDDEEGLDEKEEDESDMDEMEEDSDSLELDSKLKSKKSKAKKAPQTPNGVPQDSKGKNQSSQKQNKQQKQGGKEMKTPKSESKQKAEKKPGVVESTPQRKTSESEKKEAKTPKSPKSEGSPQKKVLEGGVICEEIRVGNGPLAKPGKMVNVYYVGTLASTKKEFDSVQGGGGFKFRLGRNEVIKGWDIGVVGMKVGGKRKLTIPPHLAYGSKGSPPVIPPNSTLVFTVELKGLS